MSFDVPGRRSSDETNAFGDIFYPLSRRIFGSNSDFVATVESKLAAARIPNTVEMYLAKSLGMGVLLGAMLWLLGMVAGWSLVTFLFTEPPTFLGLALPEPYLTIVNDLKFPFIILVTGLVFGSIGFGLGFGSMIAIPYFITDSREREINVLLSDSVSFMYALSVGGLNQLEILQAMAKAEDTYGEVSKEFESIVLETEYFDTDYRTAIRNQALQTPSDELAQFLTDMLSIINSGGDMQRFLEDQKEKHMRTSKQEQETVLETLELFGEMYMTLSLFPLLLIIILVIMSMMGEAQDRLLYVTVYALIPLVGVGFLVLVSTVVQDEVGDGYLRDESGEIVEESGGLFDLGIVERFSDGTAVFDRIESKEGTFVTLNFMKRPHLFFRDVPLAVLIITVPASVVLLGLSVGAGYAPTSYDGFVRAPVRATAFWVYLPLYLNGIPLAIFHEWNVRSRLSITNHLSDNLRKLSSANDTGMTLLESMKVVSDTSSGKLSDEFETMYAKVNYGTSLKTALREFNNKYHVPRLARTIKLISKAQEASSQITQVLSTAAQASENQDDIERERISRTRMQMVIIIMTFVTLLGVMALLKVEFLDTMAGLVNTADTGSDAGGMEFGGGLDAEMLTLLFFHAVTIQAIMSGLIAGYIRDVSIMAGLKYVVTLPTLALVVFMVI
ncbi:MAG: type II secretion system F family protein [Natronomonas sp.]